MIICHEMSMKIHVRNMVSKRTLWTKEIAGYLDRATQPRQPRLTTN